MSVLLPVRTGPKHGTYALDVDGERLVIEAVRRHGLAPIEVAYAVGLSVTTVYAILRRGGERRRKAPGPSTAGARSTPQETPEERFDGAVGTHSTLGASSRP